MTKKKITKAKNNVKVYNPLSVTLFMSCNMFCCGCSLNLIYILCFYTLLLHIIIILYIIVISFGLM